MNNEHRFVITGLSVITPAGCTKERFWQTINSGKQLFYKTKIFENGGVPQLVAKVDDTELDHGLTRRQTKRIDRFTMFSIAAAKQAIASAQIEINDVTRDRIGILLGNCTGGWAYVEPQMYPLYGNSELDAIKTYVATAWFPTAPQGEISILLGIGGFSKTIAAENLSAGFALQQALYTIREGKVDVVLVGGVEAPLTPLVYNACLQSGLISSSGTYRPFQSGADGTLLGEGAAIFVVESKAHAIARGANIYAEIVGIGRGANLCESVHQCIAYSEDGSMDVIDYVVLEGRGVEDQDTDEYNALVSALGKESKVLMSAPKSVYGNLIAASMATDIVTGCLVLEHQTIPPTAVTSAELRASPVGFHVTNTSRAASVKHVLINGRDNYGQSMSILLAKPEYQ